MRRIIFGIAVTISLITPAGAQQSAVDRLEAAGMCTDRVERARQNPEFMKWAERVFRGESKPGEQVLRQAPNEKWTVRSHFNGERLRCFMSVSVELPPADDDPTK